MDVNIRRCGGGRTVAGCSGAGAQAPPATLAVTSGCARLQVPTHNLPVQENPKNYQLWNHRRKCALALGGVAAARELGVAAQVGSPLVCACVKGEGWGVEGRGASVCVGVRVGEGGWGGNA